MGMPCFLESRGGILALVVKLREDFYECVERDWRDQEVSVVSERLAFGQSAC